MGVLARAVAMEQKSGSVTDSLELFREIYGGRASKSGQTINLDTAFKVSVAFACLKVLSQGGAQVPFKLFRETEVAGMTHRAAAKDHALYDLVATAPNDWTTSFEFRETLILHAAMGNAYAFKNRGSGGKMLEMILLDPSKVEKVQADDYSIAYKVTGKSGAVQIFPGESIWHVKGPSWNGLLGMETLNVAREALGLAIAIEDSQSKLHAKGVRPSGTYSVEGTLDPKQYRDLKAWIDKEFAGAENSGAPMILDRGAKWLTQTMTGIDAQQLETRKFQIEEVCRFFGVMPIMVGYSDKAATYASAEQMFISHVVNTLSPWYARVENSADLHLLTKKERASGLYFKFMAAGLLRGAATDRADYYAKALGSGGSTPWMVADEVRALEELNPLGGAAAALQIPINKPAPAPTPEA
jgi:HK97 family phage portal protein